MSDESAKKKAALSACKLIKNGDIIGIGTGSTVYYLIEALGTLFREGLSIQIIASSHESERLCRAHNIPIILDNFDGYIDITIDGADEITPDGSMIKGGGGALTREKLLATRSKKYVIIIDRSKKVDFLGKRSLPVEILPFYYHSTIERLQNAGYKGLLRYASNGSQFITDNGNYIFDIGSMYPITTVSTLHYTLKSIQGIVETGLFFDLNPQVICGN